MGTREELLDYLWREVIDFRDGALETIVENERRIPAPAPFEGLGEVIERVLAHGVAREDLLLIMRHTAYEAAFGTLYAIGDPGVDDDDVLGLYEGLLTANPSAAK